jgi:hypothetical protein
MSDPELALELFSYICISLAGKHAPFERLRVRNRTNVWFSIEPSDLVMTRNQAWAEPTRTDSRRTDLAADCALFQAIEK